MSAKCGMWDITIIHHGGESILGAFENGWSKLDVRYKGAEFPPGNAYLNGNASAIENTTDNFEPGDELRLECPGNDTYHSGQSITVVYTATGDVLQRILVR